MPDREQGLLGPLEPRTKDVAMLAADIALRRERIRKASELEGSQKEIENAFYKLLEQVATDLGLDEYSFDDLPDTQLSTEAAARYRDVKHLLEDTIRTNV